MNCACGNAARYIDETGALTCAICPIKAGRDSIRLADVPSLLAWARRWRQNMPVSPFQIWEAQDSLSVIIGRKP